jgi:hypothetical protein
MDRNHQANGIGNHILSTSANMLGICFVIISVVSVSGMRHKTLLDELSSIAMLQFMASCILSYCSIRSAKNQVSLERCADLIFMSALGFLSILSVIIVFGIIT